MSCRRLSRPFFPVDETDGHSLDEIASDSAGEEAGAARSSYDVHWHEGRSFALLRSSDESDFAFTLNDADLEDADSVVARTARNSVVVGRHAESLDSDGVTASASGEDANDKGRGDEALVLRDGYGCSSNHFTPRSGCWWTAQPSPLLPGLLELEKAELDGSFVAKLVASVVLGHVTARVQQRSRAPRW